MPKLILDANMLVVFVIGGVDERLLGTIKRVKEYRPTDYDILFTYLNLFTDVILLPNTVSEAANLLDQVKGHRRDTCMMLLAALTGGSIERYVPSRSAVVQQAYLKLGVTDAAILCALDTDTYLLTADRDLYLEAVYGGHEAQLFEDLR